MKKIAMIIVFIVCILGIIMGCVFWYHSATKNNTELKNEQPVLNNASQLSSDYIENQNNNEKVVSNEPIFTLENYPKVDASLAIHPLVDSIASNFIGISEEDLNFEYTKTRTSDVYKRLIDNEVDVVFVAEPSEADYAYAKEKGVELNIIPVTSSAFVFIVNAENPVDSLTLDQIVKIYKGEITNWKEVGGNDEEIIPYQRPNGSGSQTAMISLVMKDDEFMSAPKMQIEKEMGGLIDAIAEYDNAKAAIGYSYFYYVNTMYKKDTIKMLGVNGVKPSLETIKDGTYPIYTNGFIVTRKDTEEYSPTAKWVDTVLSERGSKIIEEAGYVPIH